MNSRFSSRRECLGWLGASAAAIALGSRPALANSAGASATTAAGTRKRALRVGHITDIHVQPERGAGDGLTACLRHLHAQPDKADLIINTGDSVMDCFARTHERTRLQWDLFHKVLGAECKSPIRHAIGNHDIWGWNKRKSKTTGEEANWGKATAVEAFDLKKPYYSFDQAGWHFIGLDSVYPFGERYKGRLDDKQFAWLQRDLAATDPKMPVFVYSHIPIMSIAPLLQNDASVTGDFQVPGGAMLLDNVRIKNLFKQHPNVKVCVSGHIHLLDRIDYQGVSYLCNGAVSGGWWKQKCNGECDAGYTLIDLYDDGSFEHQYVTYGWQYRVGAPDAESPA